ncbi:MAG: DNA polymerase IV [Nitrososphaerales archaeon]
MSWDTNSKEKNKQRIIFHVDFDYFFAQCEELRNPSLKGKPVVVCVYSARGGDSGAVSTSNYRAREYGVSSGIPIKLAKNRLKDVSDAKFLSVDHEYYTEMSDKAMAIIRKYADRFELVGIDEAFFEACEKLDFKNVGELIKTIKKELKDQLRLTCSIGVAPNKLVAKIASDFRKPDGLTVVKPKDVQAFLANLDVGKIIGVGKKTKERLNGMGAETISELENLDIYKLTKEFGKKIGTYLYNAARGIDEEPVLESEAITQISRITTLKKNSNILEEMLRDLETLCKDVHESAIEQCLSFRSVGITLVLDDLSIKTKSMSLKSPSTSLDELLKVSKALLEEALDESQLMVRRLGVKVSELVSSKGQDTLSKFMDKKT